MLELQKNYRKAVAWIAMNDEDGILDPEYIQSQITVQMTADLFNVYPDKIVKDIIELRKKYNKKDVNGI